MNRKVQASAHPFFKTLREVSLAHLIAEDQGIWFDDKGEKESELVIRQMSHSDKNFITAPIMPPGQTA